MEEIIDPRHLLVKIAQILEALKIPYAVTGGMAVFVWARPRFTADIDIVILLHAHKMPGLANALTRLSEASFVSRDMMELALRRRGEFNFIDGLSGVKVDFWVAGETKFDRNRMKRRIGRSILGKRVYFLSPEDLILAKLRWHKESGSELQLRDVESVLQFQKKLDRTYLGKWAKKQRTFETLQSLWKKQKK